MPFTAQVPASQPTWKWRKVVTSGCCILAIRADGTLWSWGFNLNGQIPGGTTPNQLLPIQIGTASDWVEISADWSLFRCAAINAAGELFIWGDNDPITQVAGTDWRSIDLGGSHNLAIQANGSLWAWGGNAYGQIGNGATSTTLVVTPLNILPGTTWKQASAGTRHSAAITTAGQLYVWGQNSTGQLGDGSSTDQLSPLSIGAPTAATHVSAGEYSSSFLSGGALNTAGINFLYGGLGNGGGVDHPAFAAIGATCTGAQAINAVAFPVCNAAHLAWVNGTGTARLVLVKQTAVSGAVAAPVDGTTYPANAVFGDPTTEIGSTDWYCVYDGAGTSVAVTGLVPGATYTMMVCEYSGTGAMVDYQTNASTGNPAVFSTPALTNNVTITRNTPSPAPQTNLCPGDQITLTAGYNSAGCPDPNYEWSLVGSGGVLTLLQTGGTTTFVTPDTWITPGTYKVQCTVTNPCNPCAKNYQQINLIVNDPCTPMVTLGSSPLTVSTCADAFLEASADCTAPGSQYKFYVNGTMVQNTTSDRLPVGSYNTGDVVTVALTSTACINSGAPNPVSAAPVTLNYVATVPPVASFTSTQTSPQHWTLTNTSTGTCATTCQWIWGDGKPNTSGCSPTHVYDYAAAWGPTLIVTDCYGCKATWTDNLTYYNKGAQATGEADSVYINVVDATTGIGGIMATGVQDGIIISPSPVTGGRLRVESALPFRDASLRLTDVLGRTALARDGAQGSAVTLDVSALPAGLYLLSVSDGTRQRAEKIVVR